MIEDSDLTKLAELVKKQKDARRWYNDPERAKRYGPLTESLCWIFGIMAISGIVFMLALASSDVDIVNENHKEFTNLALSKLGCDSLREISYTLLKDADSKDQYSSLRYNLNSQILTRCT